MIVNIYASSLLKKMSLKVVKQSLKSVTSISSTTCYTLFEEDAYKDDQGKAMETVVIPHIKKTNPDIVCLENGPNDTLVVNNTSTFQS